MTADAQLLRYLLAWGLVPCVFFTMSRNIIPTYGLPGIPALALAAGYWLANRPAGERNEPWIAGGLVFSLVLALAVPLVVGFGLLVVLQPALERTVGGLFDESAELLAASGLDLAGAQAAAARYDGLLKGVEGVVTPYAPEWARCVYHLYVIRVKDRDGLQRRLAEAGIDTGLHYPVPLHLQDAYRHLGYKEGDFPVSEKAAREILSLPMFPGLTEPQQQRVCDGIRRAV